MSKAALGQLANLPGLTRWVASDRGAHNSRHTMRRPIAAMRLLQHRHAT